MAEKILELEKEMARPDFWQDKEKAREILREYQELKEKSKTGGESGRYDKGNAVLTIYSGAGGDDAEDWTRMLFEMYQKFCQKRGWELKILHEHRNDFAGVKNISFEIKGKALPRGKAGVYGILKGENGVHRLVRVSPFSPKKLRHTSFAMVEVLPEFDKNIEKEIEIKPEDLKIDFFRSSGAGGQNVNKRETAVRITHLLSGLTATCQSERQQERNKEKALRILYGRLYQQKLNQMVEEKKEIRGEVKKSMAEWGRQIRSYVLHPYKLVKDHRTGVETSDVEGVLEGELDEFIKN
ncbi:MAG: Peptide chain release factor 2 [Parcubacteria group bacterium GW2011_GWB1_41_6]|nr:MAG: Peptide chain release factor 2 [Parcubacteria group bacterium GW2011_GWB1_41_6]